ncbi:MAG: Holliday junction branch migration protein RuvA [Candidatus Gracilibacteria bacterium]|jgi:Holliday junction DNA helicase RuvA|nr:Holliday junction branch migration protein RuvA [Candidatus Gracilibacteria bacterium]
MIAYLKGKPLSINERSIILETNGVGYKVKTPKKNLNKLNLNEEISFYIHSHIKEDAFDLYGFENEKEIEFFELLISVKGIGPRTGLEIMNEEMWEIKKAILEKDSKFISKIPGIGKKSAERIILELENKIEPDESFYKKTVVKKDNKSEEKFEDIIIALTKMGFSRNQVINGLSKIPKEIQKEEEIISKFLREN